MTHPDSLNALVNPVRYGQEIIINGEVYTVGNCIRQGWTLIFGDTGDIVAKGHSQVDFIAEVLKYNEREGYTGVGHSLIARMNELVDNNDHTGALLALADHIDDSIAAESLRNIQTLHNSIGYMPDALISLRDDVRHSLLAGMVKRGYKKRDIFEVTAAL